MGNILLQATGCSRKLVTSPLKILILIYFTATQSSIANTVVLIEMQLHLYKTAVVHSLQPYDLVLL
jgi:hypothetical protein